MRSVATAVVTFLTLSPLFSSTIFASSLCESAFVSSQTFLFEALPGRQNGTPEPGARRLSGLWVVEQTLAEAHAQGRNNIITLGSSASLDDPSFESTPLAAFEPKANDILVRLVTLTLGGNGSSSGHKVTMRAEQSVVNPYGDFTPAAELRLGQSLVKANGNFGLVRAIEKSPSYEDLFVLALPLESSNNAPMLVSGEVLMGMPGCEP